MVENYLIAKQVISRRLSKDHSMYPFMVCALYGLLCKYHDYRQTVLSLFSKTDIIFDEGTIEEILERHHIEQDPADTIHDDEDDILATYGVSNPGHAFTSNEKGEIVYKKQKPFIVCSTNMTSFSRLLNTFCHEMGHLIKGNTHGFYSEKQDDADIYVFRTGLAHYVYCYRNHYTELEYASSFSILDEAINCLQTTDVMKSIIALPLFVEDENIVSFIQELDVQDLEKDHGYEFIVNLVRPLWEDDTFRKTIEANITLGHIDTVIEQFDSITDEDGSFEELSYLLDYIYDFSAEDDMKQVDSFMTDFIVIVKKYRDKVKAKQKMK